MAEADGYVERFSGELDDRKGHLRDADFVRRFGMRLVPCDHASPSATRAGLHRELSGRTPDLSEGLFGPRVGCVRRIRLA